MPAFKIFSVFKSHQYTQVRVAKNQENCQGFCYNFVFFISTDRWLDLGFSLLSAEYLNIEKQPTQQNEYNI